MKVSDLGGSARAEGVAREGNRATSAGRGAGREGGACGARG